MRETLTMCGWYLVLPILTPIAVVGVLIRHTIKTVILARGAVV